MIIETSFYTGMIDENNNLVVEYNYDGYGNIISMVDNTTNKIGEKNPYRYRSYYYDSETSWYYLNSRYYNPNIGRFITMDEIVAIGTDQLMDLNNIIIKIAKKIIILELRCLTMEDL